MASAAERQKQRVIDSLKEGFEELFSIQSQKAVTGVEGESPEVSISEVSQRMAGVLVENLYGGVQDWRLLKNKPTTLQGFGISQDDSYLSSPSYFKLDEEGNVYTEKNLYSEKGVSAFGFKESGEAPGSSDVLINWEDYSEEKELWALSAKLGKSLLDGKKDYFEDNYYSKPGHKHTINDITGLGDLSTLLNWFEWDEDNQAIRVKHTLYSTGGLSAFGLGDVGGGGGGVDVLIDWASYDSTKETWALSAKLGVGLNTSLAGKQDTILPGTYAAYNHNHSIANIIDYVPYVHPDYGVSPHTDGTLGHITVDTLNSLKSILNWFEFDSTVTGGAIKAKYTLYSVAGLSAFGLGDTGSGDTSSVIAVDAFNEMAYDANRALSAYAGTRLNTELSNKQPLNAQLTALSGLTGNGLVRKTGVDTYTVDTASYAPISGSANYIQNQQSSAQAANLWISGNIYAGGNNINSFRFYNNYSGGNAGFDVYNASGTLTFSHNSNGGHTNTLGNLTVGGLGVFGNTVSIPDTYEFGWRYPGEGNSTPNYITNSYSSGGGILYSSGAWTAGNVVTHNFQTWVSGGWSTAFKIYQDQTAYFSSTVSATSFIENGTTLGNKYLGINAKATDSELLDGLDSDYFVQGTSGNRATGAAYGVDANTLWKSGFYTAYDTVNFINNTDGGFIVIPTWASASASNRYSIQLGGNIGSTLSYRSTNAAGEGSWRTLWDNTNLTNTLSPGYLPYWNNGRLENSALYDNGSTHIENNGMFWVKGLSGINSNVNGLGIWGGDGGGGIYARGNNGYGNLSISNIAGYINLNSSGNIGIGYTDRSEKLAVNGSGYFNTTLKISYIWNFDAGGVFHWGSTNNGYLTWDTGYASVRAETGNYLTLGANGYYNAIRIGTDGKVSMNYGSDQSAQLAVNGSGYFNTTLTASTSVTAPFMYATGFYHYSDTRLKNVVRPLEPVLNTIRNFSTFLYTEKRRPELGLQLGMSAQEFEAYFPTVVGRDGEDFLMLQYPRISVIAFKAIQELDSKQTSQERRILELEREVKTLKEKLYGTVNN